MRNALLLALGAAAAFAQARGPQTAYRSKIAVYDVAAKTSRVIFTADQVWEAPNWSPDGKALLVNSGGKLYRLAPEGSGPPQKIELDEKYRCNNDKGYSWNGK